MEDRRIAERETVRVNERIRAREIRVIGGAGEQLGVMTPDEARQRAEEEGLDLVEVSPNANPPVCRIMDYGKYKYEQKKKKATSKAKGRGHAASLREIKLRPRTDQHDLAVKIRKARGFLIEGDKVKITLMFRGREMVHRDLGRQQLQKVVQLLGNLATVENPPRMEGRFLFMIVVPNHQGVAEARRAEEAAKAAAAAAEAAAAGTATEKAAEEAESPAVAAGE